MAQKVSIYALIDPRSQEIGYVGKTVLPLSIRLSNHVVDSRKAGDCKRRVWIRSLIEAGVKPDIGLIELVSETEWDEAERAWIEYFRDSGQAKANTCAGGSKGGHSGWQMPEDAKRKISEALSGRPATESQLQGLRAGWSRGRKPGGWTDQVEAAKQRRIEKESERALRTKAAGELYAHDMSYEEVAQALGVCLSAAYNYVRASGEESRRPGPRQEVLT